MDLIEKRVGRPRIRTDEERRLIRNAYMRKWKALHPDRVMDIKRRYRKAHPEKENAWNAERKRRTYEWLAELKSRPCADCGGTFPPYVMDFDHVGTDKSFTISRKIGANKGTLLSEIEKCDLVCANCHRIRTKRRHDERRGLVVSLAR